ncbi:MAG: peptidoglycan-binding protein [Saprospiraceae bacterium]
MKMLKATLLSLTMIICFNLHAQEIEREMFKPYGENTNNCYGNVLMPSTYDTIQEQVVVREAYAYLRYMPAVYDTIEEKILLSPGYTRYEVIEPVFRIEKVRISLKDAEAIVNKSNMTIASKRTEKIETAPELKAWTKTKRKRNCKSTNPENCLTWEVVTIPATYIDIEKDIPSSIQKNSKDIIQNEGRFITIEKKILVEEGSVKEVNMLPEYKEVTRYVKRKNARFEEINVPAEYREVTKLRLVSEGGNIEPREVVCPKDYPDYVPSLQNALQGLGYDIGTVDGVLGRKTKDALVQYQAANNLPIGQLDFASLKRLGVIK